MMKRAVHKGQIPFDYCPFQIHALQIVLESSSFAKASAVKQVTPYVVCGFSSGHSEADRRRLLRLPSPPSKAP